MYASIVIFEGKVRRFVDRRHSLTDDLVRHLLLVIDILDFLRHTLDRKSLLVHLFVVERLVIERLGVVLGVHIRPDRKHFILQFLPLVLLLKKTLQDDWNRHVSSSLHQVKHVGASIAVNTKNGAFADLTQISFGHVRVFTIIFRYRLELFFVRLQLGDACLCRFEHHINLEPIILATEKRFLVLVLAHRIERVIFRSRGYGDPVVVQNILAQLRARRARRHGKVLWQQAVRRTATLACGQIELGDGFGHELFAFGDNLHQLKLLWGQLFHRALGHGWVKVERLAPSDEIVKPGLKLGKLAQNVVCKRLHLHLRDHTHVENVQNFDKLVVRVLVAQARLDAVEKRKFLGQVRRRAALFGLFRSLVLALHALSSAAAARTSALLPRRGLRRIW
mmetsp:Transcript_2708/g.9004  ORF Transcript_2708/g.9004 Transcript_2708/m.9004 type:complete len:392 (+) Transcript_2708:1428-2603(+)